MKHAELFGSPIPYYPEFRQITQSATSAVLMQQLEYWFDKSEGRSFWKFLSPCPHTSYRPGDSWIEELGFTKQGFRSAFDRIGNRYKSKVDFIAARRSGEVFERGDDETLYASYFNRANGLTVYLRNGRRIGAAIDEVVAQNAKKSRQADLSSGGDTATPVDLDSDFVSGCDDEFRPCAEVEHDACAEVEHDACAEVEHSVVKGLQPDLCVNIRFSAALNSDFKACSTLEPKACSTLEPKACSTLEPLDVPLWNFFYSVDYYREYKTLKPLSDIADSIENDEKIINPKFDQKTQSENLITEIKSDNPDQPDYDFDDPLGNSKSGLSSAQLGCGDQADDQKQVDQGDGVLGLGLLPAAEGLSLPPRSENPIELELDQPVSAPPSAVVRSANGRHWGDQVDLEIAQDIYRAVNALSDRPEPNWAVWANQVRLMRQRDKRLPEHIRTLFFWANQDDFWCGNILSPDKLRKQWSQLAIKRNRTTRRIYDVGQSPAQLSRSVVTAAVMDIANTDW